MRFSIVFVFLVSVLSQVANVTTARADITNISFSGHSNFEVNGNVYTIYGGITSSAGACTAAPCNTCTGTLQSCNPQEISSTVPITINFVSTKSGTPLLTVGASGSETFIKGGINATAGSTASVRLTWSELCGNTAVCTSGTCSTTCAAGFTKTFNLGVSTTNGTTVLDSTNEHTSITIQLVRSECNIVQIPGGTAPACATGGDYGIYSFSAKPGDSKIYLEGLESPVGFPNRSETQFRKLRLYYGPGNCANITSVRNSSPYVEASIVANSATDVRPSTDRFNGFSNDQSYVFKLALVDAAGNIDYFFPDNVCNNANPDQNSTGNGNLANFSAGRGTHVATPGEVVGLLSENKCFIATAAFGTPLAPELNILRRFRDNVLAKNHYGQKFIHYYYVYSPEIADRIAESKFLKTLTRAALYPAIGFAWATDHIGLVPTLCTLIVMMSFAASAVFRFKRVFRK